MSKNFKYYLEQERLRKIRPKPDQIAKLIQRVIKDIQTAEKNLTIDQDWSFTIAYHSMLRASRALLLSYGFRPTGQALEFDGSNDYVNFGQPGILDGASTYTISGWVKLDILTQDQAIFWRGVDAFNDDGSIALFFDDVEFSSSNTDVFHFIFNEDGVHYRAFTSSGFAQAGIWYHVVGVAESGKANKIYVNGIDQTGGTTGTWSGTVSSLAQNEVLGNASDGSSRAMNGLIDEVRIYNRALSAEEIEELYNAGARRFKLK